MRCLLWLSVLWLAWPAWAQDSPRPWLFTASDLTTHLPKGFKPVRNSERLEVHKDMFGQTIVAHYGYYEPKLNLLVISDLQVVPDALTAAAIYESFQLGKRMAGDEAPTDMSKVVKAGDKSNCECYGGGRPGWSFSFRQRQRVGWMLVLGLKLSSAQMDNLAQAWVKRSRDMEKPAPRSKKFSLWPRHKK